MPVPEPLPLVLLAGGTRRLERLPAQADGHPLAGYKAVDLRIGGRPLIEHVVDAFAAFELFSPIYIAGPKELYATLDFGEHRHRVRFVDTDGAFGENLRNVTEVMLVEHPGQPVAYATADIVPSRDDLARALADFERHRPCDFWMLEHRVPEDPATLGASAWKPQYRIRGDEDERPVGTLPGHLAIVDPLAVRLHLTYEIFELAYGTRNMSIPQRTWRVTVGLGARFVAAELAEIRNRRLPTVLWDLIFHGLCFAIGLFFGIDHRRMAYRLRRIFTHRPHRKAHPERHGRVAVLDVESMAKDADTEEEAQELERRLGRDAETPGETAETLGEAVTSRDESR